MSHSVYTGIDRIKVNDLQKRIRSIVEEIDAVLSNRERTRDELIKMGRDIIKLSGWIVNALHRASLEEAQRYLVEMDEKTRVFIEKARQDLYLWYSGFTNNVLSEYAEAKLFFEVVVNGRLLSHDDLGIEYIPYLQGLGDMLGEMRRLTLDMMRINDLDRAEKLLEVMEAIYYELRALEYPDALMPGVRHKIDVARRLIDDTKTLLLTIKARIAGKEDVCRE